MLRLNSIERSLIAKNEPVEKEYLRIKQFSFRKMIPKYREEALNLLTFAHINDNPLLLAIKKKYPQVISSYEVFRQYWGCYVDEAISNGLSPGVFDTENNDQFVGWCVNVDIRYQSQKALVFAENPIYAMYHEYPVLTEMEKLTHPKFPFLFDQSKDKLTSEVLIGVIDRKYQGQKLASPIIKVSEMLAKEAGYKYFFQESTHVATMKSAMKLGGYNSEVQLDAKKICIEVDGKPEYPFSELEEAHSIIYFLWKQL